MVCNLPIYVSIAMLGLRGPNTINYAFTFCQVKLIYLDAD